MPKVLAFDYGTKRTGIAISDESFTFAFGLTTVETKSIIPFLQKLFKEETIELFVIGEPKQMDGSHSESEKFIKSFIEKLKSNFNTPIQRVDERFTSKLAFDSMIAGGMKKKQRQNKAKIDEISATIILQTYLDNKSLKRN